MTKDLASVLSGLLLFAGLWLIFKYNLEWYYLFSLLIFVAFVQGYLLRFSSNKKKDTSKKASKKVSKNSQPKQKKLSDKELLIANIDSMSGDDFEHLMYLYFKDNGYKPYKTPSTGDHGVDLVITCPKDGLKIAVQCKRYKIDKGIGNADLLKLEAGKRFYKCPRTLFITTSYFTDKAKEYAEAVNMETWNGLIVREKLNNWKKEKLKSSI